jgi:poly-beta-1,6-N-acetyl-D-glucosamine synthase
MASPQLEYGVVTACRDEQENLPRLAVSLAAQTQLPHHWVIVENGSSDATPRIAAELAARYPWIDVVVLPAASDTNRGPAVVRAIQHGFARLRPRCEIVVNVDADVSMEPDYFSRLLRAFEEDPKLGIASGSAWEEDRGGSWRQRHVTRGCAWGASRAYRRACLDAVTPLEPRVGWDGIDEVKANARGWRTKTLVDLAFRHHRPEAARDGTSRAAWSEQGRHAHYLRYRPSYLVVRALFRAAHDPAALAMVAGYVAAAWRREPVCDDAAAVAYLRRQQTLRALPSRVREALGLRAAA